MKIQEKSHDLLEADFNHTLWKALTFCRMADTISHLCWWALPWAPHTGNTGTEVHRTMPGHCWWEPRVPAARWEEVTIMHRRNLLRVQLSETIWRNCLFLGRTHSCPGNIQCVLDCTHDLPATGRYDMPALSVSALPPARNPLVPALTHLVKKKVVPIGDLPYRRWQVPLLPTRADIQMTWSAVAGWTSVETSFPHYSQFPFASHRGFELFLSITAKRRLLADVSACYLFHNVSPYAWMVLFPFLTTKPVHPLIQLQPFLAGFLTDAQQPILFALRMMRIPAPWILELNFYTSYKGKGTVFFQQEYHDPLRCWALLLLQKPPFPSEERNAPQHVLSTSQDLTIKSFPEGHRVNQKQCQEFNRASWIHPLLTMSTKPCSVYTEIKQHWSCTIAWLHPICN